MEPRIRTMCSRDTKTIRICRSILHGSFASTNANWPAKCCRKCSSRPIAKLRHLLLMIIFFSLKFREYEGQKLRTKLGDLLLFSPRSPNSFLSCTLHFSKINISIASTKHFFFMGRLFLVDFCTSVKRDLMFFTNRESSWQENTSQIWLKVTQSNTCNEKKGDLIKFPDTNS